MICLRCLRPQRRNAKAPFCTREGCDALRVRYLHKQYWIDELTRNPRPVCKVCGAQMRKGSTSPACGRTRECVAARRADQYRRHPHQRESARRYCRELRATYVANGLRTDGRKRTMRR